MSISELVDRTRADYFHWQAESKSWYVLVTPEMVALQALDRFARERG